jgi:type II secretory pathway component PulC
MSLRTWAIIGGALALILLSTLVWEANRERSLRKQPPKPVVAAQPLDVTLLPEFKTSALQERKATVERPLFVPTRRPAPLMDVVVEKEPSRIERGLFVLSGTAIHEQTRIAFLRNAKDNKPKTVHIGDVVEGMNVSVITPDRVVLTAGGQEEELLLRVVAGPRGAVTPAAVAPQQQPQQQQPQQQQPQQQQPRSRQRGQAALQQQSQSVQPAVVPPVNNPAPTASAEVAPASARPTGSNRRRTEAERATGFEP